MSLAHKYYREYEERYYFFLKGTSLTDPITVLISCLIANTESTVIFSLFLWFKQSAKSDD